MGAGGKESVDALRGAQMLDFIVKDFKAAIINIFKELKETMFKELKESMITTIHQMGNIKKEVEIIRRT